ncbi:MAG: ABC transporter substrate-binding protein, partial [Bacillota bacterium]|nr:ABC transporter substrate-binding protein [Bacillota bacterium]
MRKLLSLILALAMLVSLVSCGGGGNATEPATTSGAANNGGTTAPSTSAPEPKKEQVINSIYSGEVTTINYLQTASTNEFALACNLVDSLIDYDKYGVIQPALAESWSSSEDGLVWTFKIRPGVQWVNFKGEEVAEVVADDWVAAMEYVLNPDNASQTAQITYSVIKNA